MSNIYIQEPPTNGKVLLNTTVGDIDIELWSKEAPKACRNFIQLCLENYYDGTIFHRVVKGFIVQGGDPTGTGTGGESVYGHPFKDEFHSRLRFVRRGLVAMANSGKDDNESQFFFTLGSTPELQNKHTIFGKVTGNTLYNMLKFEEGLVDQDDRPIYPHKIISCKVLSNPFPDIVARTKNKEEKNVADKPKEKIKKNFKLLSFGEEAEEDEAEVEAVNKAYKGQSKSSHDLANDPKLSSVPAINFKESENLETLDNIRKKFDKSSHEREESRKKIIPLVNKESKHSENIEVDDKRKEIQKQIKELKKELRTSKKIDILEEETEKEHETGHSKEDENNILSEYHHQLEKYQNKSKSISRKGTAEREQQTLKFLEKFKSTLEKAKKSA